MRTLLLLSAALAVLLLSTPASAEEVIALNQSRPHLLLLGGLPDLRVYERPGLTGKPALKLDARGLEVHGRLACVWPGGDVDELNDPTVVLEAAGAPGRPCAGYPIISTWTDADDGPAVLFIEVVRWTGTLIEVELDGKPHYLDSTALPPESLIWLAPGELPQKGEQWEDDC